MWSVFGMFEEDIHMYRIPNYSYLKINRVLFRIFVYNCWRFGQIFAQGKRKTQILEIQIGQIMAFSAW